MGQDLSLRLAPVSMRFRLDRACPYWRSDAAAARDSRRALNVRLIRTETKS